MNQLIQRTVPKAKDCLAQLDESGSQAWLPVAVFLAAFMPFAASAESSTETSTTSPDEVRQQPATDDLVTKDSAANPATTSSAPSFAEKEGLTEEVAASSDDAAAGEAVVDLSTLPTVEALGEAEQQPFSFLASQVAAGEAEEALISLDSEIGRLEQLQHRYHESLLEPVNIRGDAYFALKRFDEALNEYGRAKHIARVSHGLFDPRQIPSVYREAKVLRLLGNVEDAGKREEYAYEVARRSYEDYDQALLPATTRLARFYMNHNNPLAARSLLNRAHLIHQYHNTMNTDEAVTVLRDLAQSHRVERFPPVYIDRADQERTEGVFGARLRNTDLQDQNEFINSFPAGERALQQVVSIQRVRYSEDSKEVLEALIELADWHLMFGRTQTAHTLYEHVYLTAEGPEGETVEDAVNLFAEPVLLHFPRPPSPRPPALPKRGDEQTGFVAVTFNVSPTGAVRKLKTLEVDGPKSMNFRVRRSMREAIFRPRMEDGSVAPTEEHTFRYQFSYFAERGVPTEVEDGAEVEEQATDESNTNEEAASAR